MDEKKEKNLKSNLVFIEKYVKYLERTPNEIWSKHQSEFIDSIIRNANQNRELYLKIKNNMKSLS